MPFSPFFGVSVLIHVFIIALYSARGGKPIRKNMKTPKTGISYLSYVVMAAIFLFVSASATLLVYRSVDDAHSSVHLIEAMLQQPHAVTDAPPVVRQVAQ